MRSIGGLEENQKGHVEGFYGSFGVPLVEVEGMSNRGADAQVLMVTTTEEPYSGKASVILRGEVPDMVGQKITIAFGFEDAGTSPLQPFWVMQQKSYSAEGEVITQLECVSIWELLAN